MAKELYIGSRKPNLVAHPVYPQFEPFTFAVYGDTQYLVKNADDNTDWSHVSEQTSWVDANCVASFHVGDIVHGNTDASQVSGSAPYYRDNVTIPGFYCWGNWDTGDVAGTQYARNRVTTNIRADYGTSDVDGEDWFGGTYDGTTDNWYGTFGAGHKNYLVICLQFGPLIAHMQWATELSQSEAFSDYHVIVLTHSYIFNEKSGEIDPDELVPRDSDHAPVSGFGPAYWANMNVSGNDGDDAHSLLVRVGEEMWDEYMIDWPNLRFVFCGHAFQAGHAQGYLEQTGSTGNTVHSFHVNYQNLQTNPDSPLIAEDYIRLLEFHPGGRIEVTTYSPYRDDQAQGSVNRSNNNEEFTITGYDP